MRLSRRLRQKRTPAAIGDAMQKDKSINPATPESDRDVAFVKALAGILQENCLEELEFERHRKGSERLTVRISRRSGATTTIPKSVPAVAPVAPVAPVSSAPPTPPEPAPLSPETAVGDPTELPGAVISPMVGTAYLAPEPGAAPFVCVGDSVTEGQTLLIIEAMKTMNQIHATTDGVVKRILVEDASPVEYGAPLMIVG